MVNPDVGSRSLVKQNLIGRAIVGFLYLLGLLPFSLRGRIGAALGSCIGLLPIRERQIVTEQLRLFAPQLSRSVRPYEVFANVARVTMESINLAPVLKDPDKYVTCKNWDAVQTWIRDKRPLVVLTAHFGNWDLLAAYAIAKGIPVTTIGREARNPGLQEGLRWMRDRYGVETLWRSDKAALKRLISCMREKQVIAALIDQDTRVESIFTPFFGIPTRTPSSLVELGKKFNARFVYAFLHRVVPGAASTPFELITGELVCDSTAGDSFALEVLTQYHQQLERCIAQSPEQWVWFHKRWRSQPDRDTMSSREYIAWLKRSRPEHTSA